MKTVRPCFALFLAILVLSNSAVSGFWFSKARKVAEATVAVPEEPSSGTRTRETGCRFDEPRGMPLAVLGRFLIDAVVVGGDSAMTLVRTK